MTQNLRAASMPAREISNLSAFCGSSTCPLLMELESEQYTVHLLSSFVAENSTVGFSISEANVVLSCVLKASAKI